MGNQMIGSEAASEEVAKEVKSVSLLVTPIQAELLKYAEKKGTLHLTLRSTLDKAPVISEGADEEQLERLQNELAREMNPESMEEGPQPPQQSSFADFVKQDAAPPAPVDTNKVTWKVQVFQGPDQKTYEFEEVKPETKPTDAAEPADKSSADLWSPVKQWLFGGGRASKTALVTP
jgi:hypothetical protein